MLKYIVTMCLVVLLHICYTNGFLLSVEPLDRNDKKPIELYVFWAFNTVKEVKEAIMKTEKIPTEKQVLWYNDKQLENDEQTLLNLGIRSGAKLQLRTKFKIKVMPMMGGDPIRVIAHSGNTINDVMRTLPRNVATMQALYPDYVSKEPLLGAETLAHYGIKDGTILWLFFLPTTKEQLMENDAPITMKQTREHAAVPTIMEQTFGNDAKITIKDSLKNNAPIAMEQIIENGVSTVMKQIKENDVPITVEQFENPAIMDQAEEND